MIEVDIDSIYPVGDGHGPLERELVQSIRKYGQLTPIRINRNGGYTSGPHRVAALSALGRKTILVEKD